jgi:flagellar hook-associated protein 2
MGIVNLISGGLDVTGIVDNLIYVQREPIRRLEEQTKAYQDKLSAYQAFNTKLLAFKTAVESLLYKGETAPLSLPSGFEERLSHSIFALRTAKSSDEAVLTASASKGTTTGNFTVTVSRLAKSDTYASNNFATDISTLTQTGTLVIQKGSDDPVTITIDDSNNTLQGIKNAINNADAGFTASIIRDGSAAPYRLVITSDDSGTANALTITNNVNQGAGQALSLTQTIAADDAALQINGVDITSSSNSVSDAIEGVTLQLKASSGTAVVTIERDIDAIVEGVKDLAVKYNDVVAYIKSQFRYDSTKKQAGILSGDFTLRETQSMLSSTLSQSISSDNATLSLLSQVGLNIAGDGTLSVDETKLKQSLSSDFRGTAHVLLADALNQAGNAVSIAPRLYDQLKNLTDSLEGPVFRAQDAAQQNITRINKQIQQMEDRLEVQRELLTAEFSRADQALKLLTVLQNSLTSQVNTLQSLF